MLTAEQKKQFTIFVFDKNLNTGPSTKVALVQSGFEAQYFNESGSIKAMIESNIPHLVIIDVNSLDEPLTSFVGFINRISPEILFIFIADQKDFHQLMPYKDYGLFQIVSKDLNAFEDRMVLLVEDACQGLFLFYQNQQIYNELQLKRDENVKLKEQLVLVEKSISSNMKIPERLNDYRSAESNEVLVQKFLNQFPGSKIIYFKYLDGVRSLVAMNAQGVEISNLSGLGLQIEVKELKTFYNQLLLGLAPAEIISAVATLFGVTNLKAFPLYVSEKLEGFFMTVDQNLEMFESDLSLFSLAFSHLNLEKRIDILEVRDLLTGLLNRQSYLSRLKEEVVRSVRKNGHFSVIKISLDHIDLIERDYGEIIRDESLKLVGYYMQKLCRATDEIFRTDFNEFAIFLPDTSKEESSVFCERVRRYFNSHSMSDKGFQSTLSFGITECPLLAQTVEAVDASVTKAMRHVQAQGGDKICFLKKTL